MHLIAQPAAKHDPESSRAVRIRNFTRLKTDVSEGPRLLICCVQVEGAAPEAGATSDSSVAALAVQPVRLEKACSIVLFRFPSLMFFRVDASMKSEN